MDMTMIFPIFLNGTLISSAVCGMTSNPMKKNGVSIMTVMVPLIASPVSSLEKRWLAAMSASPAMNPDAIMKIPTPTMMTVMSVWKIAACFTPRMLRYVMKSPTATATMICVAYTS